MCVQDGCLCCCGYRLYLIFDCTSADCAAYFNRQRCAPLMPAPPREASATAHPRTAGSRKSREDEQTSMPPRQHDQHVWSEVYIPAIPALCLRARLHLIRNHGPLPGSATLHQLHQAFVLRLCPATLLDRRIRILLQDLLPAAPVRLSCTPGQLFRNLRPPVLETPLRSDEYAVLLGRPLAAADVASLVVDGTGRFWIYRHR